MNRMILLIVGILLLVPNVFAVNHFYEINLVYKQGDISYDSVTVKPIYQEIENNAGGYVAEVVSVENKILNVTFFSIPLKEYYDSFDEESGEVVGGGIIELDETEITLNLPYFDNAKEIRIYNKSLNLKLRIDISSYSREIQPKEVGVIEETSVKEKVIIPEKEPEERQTNYIWFLIIGLAIVFVIFIVLLLRKESQ